MNWVMKLFNRRETATQDSPIFRASMPRARVVAVFVPRRSFRGENKRGELLGIYKQGSRYYIREGNNMLAELCAEWEAENLITIQRSR